jgi:hypothetical protein
MSVTTVIGYGQEDRSSIPRRCNESPLHVLSLAFYPTGIRGRGFSQWGKVVGSEDCNYI